MKRPTKPNAPQSHAERLLALVRTRGTVRASEAAAEGIPWVYVRRLLTQGRLQQVARGVYRAADDEQLTEGHGFVLVALKTPGAVISLLSALAFHQLTTQAPSEVWITIGPKARVPRLEWPPLRITRASGASLTAGIEKHVLEGVSVQVYSPAKTVADCFKYRNKVGLDVALEALREFQREHRGKMDELERFAQVCRVSRVMRPYLEALAS